MTKSFLILSNMYPTQRTPTQGVFVKNIETSLLNSGVDVDKVVLAGRHDNYLAKAWFYLKYIFSAFLRLLFTRRIIYLHYVAHSAIPLLMAGIFRTHKVVAHVHGGDVLPADYEPELVRKIKLWISRRALSKAQTIIVPSLYFKELLTEAFDVQADMIKVNPSGGVDTDKFNTLLKQEPSYIQHKQLVIGYVGRLDSGKGIETLIESLRELQINFHCHFVGTGSRHQEFKQRIVEFGLSEKVTFHGAVKQAELPKFYCMFDFLVFPSEMQESLGLVGLEAMACGTPVIGTINAGMADYLHHEENGFGFVSGDANSLRERIIQCAAISHHDYNELSGAARKTALSFDAQLSNRKLLEILQL